MGVLNTAPNTAIQHPKLSKWAAILPYMENVIVQLGAIVSSLQHGNKRVW